MNSSIRIEQRAVTRNTKVYESNKIHATFDTAIRCMVMLNLFSANQYLNPTYYSGSTLEIILTSPFAENRTFESGCAS